MTKEAFMALAGEKWDSLSSLQQTDFYEFEKQFEVLILELGRTALEGVLGEVPQDRRKKKVVDPVRDGMHIKRT